MAKAKDVIEKGAKEAATLPMALGVVAVLSSGTVISTYICLLCYKQTCFAIALYYQYHLHIHVQLV